MIRGSVVIAAIAVLLSLLLHALGLSLTAPRWAEPPPETGPTDRVELGNRFEDLAETVPPPVHPEPAETPDPPVAEQPEPAEIPTSDVHVASDDPQHSFAPDTGTAELVQPVAPEPVPPDTAEAERTADQAASDDVDETPSVATAEVSETPEGTPDAAEPAVEAEIPVADPVPDADEDGAATERAVTPSIRPQRPNPAPQGVLGGSRDFSDLRFPTREVESPLATYRRSGIDRFTQSDSGTRSGGRGPGNSDRTNYAGRVLVHLNRAPVVYTAARGFATVFFEISPNGSLAWVEVVDSSGTPDVERAAKAQVRAASPFPRPPGGVSRKLTFVYSSN